MSSGAPIPEGSVVITPAEVYAKVATLTQSVDRLLAQNERVAEDRQAMKDLEGRVTALERKMWIITGAAATLGGTIGSYLPTLLAK